MMCCNHDGQSSESLLVTKMSVVYMNDLELQAVVHIRCVSSSGAEIRFCCR